MGPFYFYRDEDQKEIDLLETYSSSGKLAPLVRETAWSHNPVILEQCTDPLEREFYVRMTKKFGWSKPCRQSHPLRI